MNDTIESHICHFFCCILINIDWLHVINCVISQNVNFEF
jgi:hypothetical protein